MAIFTVIPQDVQADMHEQAECSLDECYAGTHDPVHQASYDDIDTMWGADPALIYELNQELSSHA